MSNMSSILDSHGDSEEGRGNVSISDDHDLKMHDALVEPDGHQWVTLVIENHGLFL